MFQAARKHMRAIAMLGVAAALVVGGVAAAQGGSQSSSQGDQSTGTRPPGPPPGGPMMMGGDLTYAELHVQKDGKAETIRIDQGKITAVDDSSVTVAENDGSEVTIPVDGDTQVLGPPQVTFSSSAGRNQTFQKVGGESTLDDLGVGQQVTVSAPEGGTAESIMVLPKKGEMTGAPMGGPMPPPPTEQQGSGN